MTRSRHRNKSRGKSRHRSSQSTARPTVGSGHPRTKSNPPQPATHKTQQEIQEDHEYVNRVLAYLEQPDSPSKHSKKKLALHVSKQSAHLNLGANKSAVHNLDANCVIPIGDKKPKSSLTERSELTNIAKRGIICEETTLVKSSCNLKSSTGKFAAYIPSKFGLLTGNKYVEHLMGTDCGNAVTPDIFPNNSYNTNLSSELKPVDCDQSIMANSIPKMTAEDKDNISALCSLLTQMGACQVPIEQIKKPLQSATNSHPTCNGKNELQISRIVSNNFDSKVLQTNVAVIGSQNLEASQVVKSSAIPLKAKCENQINGSNKISQKNVNSAATEVFLVKKRKNSAGNVCVNKEAGNSIFVNSNTENHSSSTVLSIDNSKKCSTVDVSSDNSQMSKAELKRERRAMQEAQRAAKEKAAAPPPVIDDSIAKTTTAPKKSAAHGRHRILVKGGSSLPYCGYLRDYSYTPEEPSYAYKVHPRFTVLTGNLIVSN